MHDRTPNDALQALAHGSLRLPQAKFWLAFEAAWPTLERFAMYRVGFAKIPRELSKDCVQEFFRRVCKYRAGYRGDSEGELWTWLTKVFHNALRDMMRRELRRRVSPMPHDSAQLEDQASREPLERFGRRDDFAALESCLGSLSEEGRMVIQLRYFEPRLTQRGAAAALGCSAGWVCKIERKALRSLLLCMQAKGIEFSAGRPMRPLSKVEAP